MCLTNAISILEIPKVQAYPWRSCVILSGPSYNKYVIRPSLCTYNLRLSLLGDI